MISSERTRAKREKLMAAVMAYGDAVRAAESHRWSMDPLAPSKDYVVATAESRRLDAEALAAFQKVRALVYPQRGRNP